MSVVKEVAGIPISVDGEGKFSAKIDGKITRRVKLSDLEKIIRTRNAVEIDAIVLSNSGHDPRRQTIVGYSGGTSARPIIKEGGWNGKTRDTIYRYDTAYHFDQEAWHRLVTISAQIKELDRDRRAIIDKLRRVSRDDLIAVQPESETTT